ncbi:MAG: diaminopimelate decarboxylase [Bacteroidetes bacterium]|nr:diaminopimelate decarboxylase [Bacteroidota bacterium]
MIKGSFPIEKFKNFKTPFYYYDIELLRQTLSSVMNEANKYGYQIHYAIKANTNPKILSVINSYNLGADCVSGGEIQASINAGFSSDKIVYAGVGKSDWEIELGLERNIFCFNVESEAELEVINEIASKKNKIANIALRINPEVNANTHHYITTGLAENKFGISISALDEITENINNYKNIKLVGLHFHIGSQIMDMLSFKGLCVRVNEIQEKISEKKISIEHINLGGGLGIDYHHPNHIVMPDFKEYFSIFKKHLKLYPEQNVHFELGRSIVGQCGSLVSKVLYIKQGKSKKFAIVDAGFTELLRPALYQAYHRIENISSDEKEQEYDVVGPICESSDVFGKNIELNTTKRGDYIVFRSAGAYGEVMASQYNCRELPKSYFSDEMNY